MLLAIGIYFSLHYLFKEDCLESFNKYDCAERGKNSKMCINIMSCLKEDIPIRNCEESEDIMLIGILAFVFAYFTFEHRNPLILMKVVK